MPRKAINVDEIEFQDWFRKLPWHAEFSRQFGEAPNPNTPIYDYRLAHRLGVSPERYEEDAGRYHWPSRGPSGEWLKSPNHPTAWMEGFMATTGQDPVAVGVPNARVGWGTIDKRMPRQESPLEILEDALRQR